jgi:nucleotide-binding universal stress UspA family protein
LHVVHVWGPDGVFPTENALAQGKLEGWRKDAAELLATRVDPWRTKFPHVPISGVLRQDHVVRALVAESQTALALVVGGHDANRAHAFLAASTTSGVLHHAECPILVLPDTR